MQTFLARRDGEVVGRIAGIVNHEHNRHFKERRGFFGFFECINDKAVAHALFDAAPLWLAERNLHALRGPMNPSLNYEIGLLIEGFDDPPTFMMTYNPPYYSGLIESYGFAKAHDLYSYLGAAGRFRSPTAARRNAAGTRAEMFNLKIAGSTANGSRQTWARFCTSITNRASIFGDSCRLPRRKWIGWLTI